MPGEGIAALSKLAPSSLWQDDVHFGTHLEVWGSWYDTERNAWGYACCKGLQRKRARCPKTSPGEADGDGGQPGDQAGAASSGGGGGGGAVPGDDEEEEMVVKVSQRMADMLDKCPGFSGDVPTPEQERGWTEAELRNFVFSNGLIRPARTHGEQRPPPTAADWKALELAEGADPAAAKKAYRRLALLNHPDKHHGEKEKAKATEAFRRIATAYEAIVGHAAEVPALAAATNADGTAVKRRRWRIVIVKAAEC